MIAEDEARPERKNLLLRMLINEMLEQVRDIEQGIYYNLPENLSMGDKAEKAQEGISTLDDAITDLESIDMNLTEAFGEPTGREKEPTQMQLEA